MPSLDGKFSTYRILRDTRHLKHEGTQSDADVVSQGAPVDQEIDLQALAHKIYALLKQELQLERERLGRSGRW